jgi:hypothetical protein
LLWKRAWRCLAGCVAGVILFLYPGVVPGALLGFEENQQQMTSWYRVMVRPYVVENKVEAGHSNQSLVGLVFRLTTHTPSFAEYDFATDRYVPLAYANVASLTPAEAKGIILACEVLFAGLVLWRCRAPLAVRQGWRLYAEFAVVLLGMLLFSERTWKHHCVTLVLPFAVLCYYLAVEAQWGVRIWLIAALVVTTLLLATTSTGLLEESAKQAQVYGAYVFAFLVLLAGLFLILSRHRGETVVPQALPLAQRLHTL